jgi:hypothetical protein
MIISGFERSVIPIVDSPPGMVFERGGRIVHSVLHENFFFISFAALLELLFYNAFLAVNSDGSKPTQIIFI